MTAKVCTYSELQDRYHLALARARRSKQLVLLLLIRLRAETAVDPDALGDGLSALAIRRIGTCLRSSDTVCLHDKHELAVLLEDVRDPSFVPSVIEKLHATFTHPIHAAGNRIALLPSYGASLYPNDGHDTEALWKCAEQALQSACNPKSGDLRLAPGVAVHSAMKEIELDRELHQAYQNREFRLVYQPVFTIDRERVSAVEAFIRWDHPQRGPQLPKSFLNRLEETGLIVSVGERVLQETCQFARDLLDEGHEGIRVCVNISARQLTDPGFLLCALDALYDAGLDPSLLQLEFSEETLASIPDVARQLLPDIRKARIRVAVDHFGSGSSSLAELIRLPVSLVKIDRRLVTTITDDPVASAITSGIFVLAQGTGMDVAAVGVEAATQISVLNNMGCKEIQGNFLADVLTGSELEPWLPDQDTT